MYACIKAIEREERQIYCPKKKPRTIKIDSILSGAISNCPSAHLYAGATYFDLFYFSHNDNKEIWGAKNCKLRTEVEKRVFVETGDEIK